MKTYLNEDGIGEIHIEPGETLEILNLFSRQSKQITNRGSTVLIVPSRRGESYSGIRLPIEEQQQEVFPEYTGGKEL